MNHKIIAVAVDEIAVDYEDVARRLNRQCVANGKCYKVSGVCQTLKNVFFTFEDYPAQQSIRYVLAPFSSIIDEDIIADLYSRWQSGFTTKGMIRLSESYVGLFEIPVDTLNIEPLGD